MNYNTKTVSVNYYKFLGNYNDMRQTDRQHGTDYHLDQTTAYITIN